MKEVIRKSRVKTIFGKPHVKKWATGKYFKEIGFKSKDRINLAEVESN